MKGVLLHGGNEKITGWRDGQFQVRSGPFQGLRRLFIDARKPRHCAIIAGAIKLAPRQVKDQISN